MRGYKWIWLDSLTTYGKLLIYSLPTLQRLTSRITPITTYNFAELLKQSLAFFFFIFFLFNTQKPDILTIKTPHKQSLAYDPRHRIHEAVPRVEKAA